MEEVGHFSDWNGERFPEGDDYRDAYRRFLLSGPSLPKTPDRPEWGMGWEEPRIVEDELTETMTDCFLRVARQFLTGDGTKNSVCSPLSIYIALGMLAEVTGGRSREQILSLLGARGVKEVRKLAKAVWEADYRNGTTGTCSLANSFWMNQRFTEDYGALKKSVLDSLAQNFYASSFLGPGGETEYDEAFQAWMNEQTGGMLTELVKEMKISEDAVLELVSAIHFRARWRNDFYKGATKPRKFYVKSERITCDFMRATGGVYYKGAKFAAVPKPLTNGGEMWFILPNKGVTPEKLLAETELARFLFGDPEKFYYRTEADELRVYEVIPKFDISAKIDLVDGLKRLGVTDVFDEEVSDFTPMWEPLTEREKGAGIKFRVSKADHDAGVSIDEEGCKAAAVTRVEVLAVLGSAYYREPKTVEEIKFIVNRPFLFAITDASRLPLFVGIVNRPVE